MPVLLSVLMLASAGQGYDWTPNCAGCSDRTAGPCMNPSTSKCSAYTDTSTEQCGIGEIKCGSEICQTVCPEDSSQTSTAAPSTGGDSDCDGCSFGAGPCKSKAGFCRPALSSGSCPDNFSACKTTTTARATTTSKKPAAVADARVCILMLGGNPICTVPSVHHTASTSCPVLMCDVSYISCIPPSDQKSMLACDRDFYECDKSTSSGKAFLIDFQDGCASTDSSTDCLIEPGNTPNVAPGTTVWSDESYCNTSPFAGILFPCCRAKEADGSCSSGYASCTTTLRKLGKLTTSSTTTTTGTAGVTTTVTTKTTTLTTAATTTKPTTTTATTTPTGDIVDCDGCTFGSGPCKNSVDLCIIASNGRCPTGFSFCTAVPTTTTATTATATTVTATTVTATTVTTSTVTTVTTSKTTTTRSTTTTTTSTTTTRTTTTVTTYAVSSCYGKREHPICGEGLKKDDCENQGAAGIFARANCPVMCGTCTSTTTTTVTTVTTTTTVTTKTTMTTHTTTTHTTTITATSLTTTTTQTTSTKTSTFTTTTTIAVTKGAPCANDVCTGGNAARNACYQSLSSSDTGLCLAAVNKFECFPGFQLCSELDCPYADDRACRSCNGVPEPEPCGSVYAKGGNTLSLSCGLPTFKALCPVVCGVCVHKDRTTKTSSTVTSSTVTTTTATKSTTTSTSSTSTTATDTSISTTTHTATTATTVTTITATYTTLTSTTRTTTTVTSTTRTTTTATTTTTVTSSTTTYTTKPGDTTSTKTRTSTTTVTATTTTSTSSTETSSTTTYTTKPGDTTSTRTSTSITPSKTVATATATTTTTTTIAATTATAALPPTPSAVTATTSAPEPEPATSTERPSGVDSTSTMAAVGDNSTTPDSRVLTTTSPSSNADGSAGAKNGNSGTIAAVVVILIIVIGAAIFVYVRQRNLQRTHDRSADPAAAYETSNGAISMGSLADANDAGKNAAAKMVQRETSFDGKTTVQTLDLDAFSAPSPEQSSSARAAGGGDEDRSPINVTSFQPTASYLEHGGPSYLSNGGESYVENGGESDGYIETTADLRRHTSAASGITLTEFGAEDELAC